MLRIPLVLALTSILALPAVAEVLIETSSTPLSAEERAALAETLPTARAPTDRPKQNTPGDDWFIPRFRVDRRTAGDTTLLAIHAAASSNPCDGEICSFNVDVYYYDVRETRQHVDRFNLEPHQVQTINVRDVPGLAVDPDGYARGLIRVVTTTAMNVDYFQVDTAQNFATGGEAMEHREFCETWTARFLTFGPGQATVLSVLVRYPRGGAASDRPSVVGTVYDEAGNFVNRFSVRTDDWAFDLDVRDLVAPGVLFGTIELTLYDELDDAGSLHSGGLVTVSHAAQNRFSIGARAYCSD